MKKVSPFLFIVLLNSCGFVSNFEEGPIVSPDSKLELSAFINRTDNTKPNYSKVVLIVKDRSNGEAVELETSIGSAMKWAIDWYDSNIIVAQSSDIGTRSWKFKNGNFEKLSVTVEMHDFADELRIRKYQLEK